MNTACYWYFKGNYQYQTLTKQPKDAPLAYAAQVPSLPLKYRHCFFSRKRSSQPVGLLPPRGIAPSGFRLSPWYSWQTFLPIKLSPAATYTPRLYFASEILNWGSMTMSIFVLGFQFYLWTVIIRRIKLLAACFVINQDSEFLLLSWNFVTEQLFLLFRFHVQSSIWTGMEVLKLWISHGAVCLKKKKKKKNYYLWTTTKKVAVCGTMA